MGEEPPAARGLETTLPLLSRERIVAEPGFNRWLIPPAALLIHLSIGQAYAISVFNLPLSRALGVTRSLPEDWKLATLGWIFTLAIVFLGLSAAFAGRWLEQAGPRKVGVVAACCWGGGFLLAALGVFLHAIALVYLGYGVVGGCGLGLGYVSPVSTLIKWFPDRRGMAAGMAIMGFGGGALIAAPLSDALMRRFAAASSVGVWQTFVVLGLLYFGAMLLGAFGFRLPPPGSVGLLSLFNIAGRFFWASLSDTIGRKPTYAIFFGLGALLYASVPLCGRIGSVALFVLAFAVILTMYGGGFATIPAYLADVFGACFVGAIHGRLLTAWSMAGVLGPVLVNYLREEQIARGVAKAQAYNATMEIMAGLLVLGFVCNLAVRRIAERHDLERPSAAATAPGPGSSAPWSPAASGDRARIALAWTLVGLPLGWGIASTLGKALQLFR